MEILRWQNAGYNGVIDKTKTGPLIKEGIYKEGKKTGEWKEYYNNGKLKSIYNYKSDKLFGAFKQFNEKGELISHIENFNENNPDIYLSVYKSKSIIPAILKVIKSSENKLMIEGLKDFFGDSFTNREELIKVSKHKYKIELKNLDKIFFEFTPYNSELILNINTNKVDMNLTFRKIIK
ncbi:toxin-antitoxin system YwqK family antitoxin [Polaribacter sp. Hel_I_88]|uniref:toxin-antitoxin system YwqK family antitoxin n=1 Tax=Polaribacter sp. Hel_I_88 TaxID=1250006 RepID=UPI00047E0BE2|nr:hypothetical protein [Polaribacter sp. Hel_I_88]